MAFIQKFWGSYFRGLLEGLPVRAGCLHVPLVAEAKLSCGGPCSHALQPERGSPSHISLLSVSHHPRF